MEELKKEMNAAYKLISAIPVRDEMVDIMAEAKRHLRAAYKIVENMEKENG